MDPYNNPDLRLLIGQALKLALINEHTYIDPKHCLAAMVITSCAANSRLQLFSAADFSPWLKRFDVADYEPTADLPITMELERVLRHAVSIASRQNKQQPNSTELLLAMVSFDNEASDLINKKGIVYEDLAEGVPFYPPTVKTQTFTLAPWIKRALGLALSKKKLMTNLHDHANELWSYQQYDDCVKTCETGLSIDPTVKELKSLLAFCHFRKHEYEKAIPLFEEQAGVSHAHSLMLAYSLDASGQPEQGETILRRMLQHDDEDAFIYNNLGFNLHLQNRHTEAVMYYEKAIRIKPHFAYPYNNLGFAKYKLGDRQEGIRLIDHSLTLDRGNSYAYMFKGTIFLEAGEYALAKEQFELALRYGFTRQYGNEVLELMKQLPG